MALTPTPPDPLLSAHLAARERGETPDYWALAGQVHPPTASTEPTPPAWAGISIPLRDLVGPPTLASATGGASGQTLITTDLASAEMMSPYAPAAFLSGEFQAEIGPGLLAGLWEGLTALPDALRHAPEIATQVKTASAELLATLHSLKTAQDWERLALALGVGKLVDLQRQRLRPYGEQGYAFGKQLGEIVLLPLGDGAVSALKGGGGLAKVLRELRESLHPNPQMATEAGALPVDPTVTATQGSRGQWNKQLNGEHGTGLLIPDEDYVVGGHTYLTDSAGRVKQVESTLKAVKNDRNPSQQGKAGKRGAPGDQGGHLIACIFDGPGEVINYAAMHENLNKGVWKAMENNWARLLAEGKNVRVRIEIEYGDPVYPRRPLKFQVTEWVDGQMQRPKEFYNAPEGKDPSGGQP